MLEEGHDQNLGSLCAECEPLLVLLAAGELEAAEQSRVTQHLAHCADCTHEFEEQKKLLALLSENHVEPDAALLASCRASFLDALDRTEDAGWMRRAVRVFLPDGWFALRPALSAALLLLAGFSIGVLGPRWLARTSVLSTGSASDGTASNVNSQLDSPLGASRAPIDIHTAEVAGINVERSGSEERPEIELQLKAQQPLVLHGTVDNTDVKSLLLNVLRNNRRFDPEMRLDAVDLLRSSNNEPEVRSALCHVVHTDNNAAVRLKALEALNGAEPQDLVRQTLLDALVQDQNPGVRVEAINALRDMAAKGEVDPDSHMIEVLREREKNDPNNYIRLQSAAAIRDLGPRQKF
jgi:hypothetical protein